MKKADLITQIDTAIKRAHAPYSQFHVGAVIIDEQGNNHAGCNVENAAYPSGCCAEQSAVSNMIIQGGKTIKDIYIKSSSDMPCPPCGNCRQIISEFSDAETKIHMLDGNNEITSCTLEQLLPSQFNADWLKTE
nr:cytidine deaminase [Marinicella rhabdoformis]